MSASPDCLRTNRLAGLCAKCDARLDVAHIPTKLPGAYCSQCCPACSTQPRLEPADAGQQVLAAKPATNEKAL